MEKKEALLITEEILDMLVSTHSTFQENMHEYVCDTLDISDDVLAEVLDMIKKMRGKNKKER